MDRSSLLSEQSDASRDPPMSASSSQSNIKARNKKPYSRPKPRFNQPSAKLAYAEKSLPATLSTRVIKYYHPIHTNTSGIDAFSKFVYQTYSARDKRLENAFSQELLSYVSTLALTYKIYRLSNRLCYGMRKPSFYSELEEFSTALTLPEPIAKYIESVGKVPIPSGICLVPYAPTESELTSHPGFPILRNLVEDIPAAADDPPEGAVITTDDKIFLSSQHVGNYMMGAAIGAKFGTLFRKVDWSIEDGTLSFVSAFTCEPGTGKMIGYSPCEMDQVQCQLGACYRLRDVASRDTWIGMNQDYRLVHETDSFHENVFIVDKIMNHMMAR